MDALNQTIPAAAATMASRPPRRRGSRRTLLRTAGAVAAAALAFGATAAVPANTPADVAQALGALRQAEVVYAAADGMPSFLRGDLGQAPRFDAANLPATQRAMRPVLAPALAALRLQANDLRLRRVNAGSDGNQHLRYAQTHQGLDVVGGDLIVHIDGSGRVFALNGSARGDLPDRLGAPDVGESAVHPRVAADPRYAGMSTTPPRLVYLALPDGPARLAYETEVTGQRGLDPVHDRVYIDAGTGALLAAHPQIHFALSRGVYSAKGTTTLPGTRMRYEGQAASSDADVNTTYDALGNAYAAYKAFWNRDSYDNYGSPITASVHYSQNYCNAFWNGTQVAFGDGNTSAGCLPLDRGLDITAHEYTHGVTAWESALQNGSESGGLSESLSDIFGAFVEAWVAGGKTGTLAVSANTWKMGEGVLPSTMMRVLNDPAADGHSLDYWTTSAKNADVHDSAGISNLAFYLLSQGGRHPRGKSTIQVAGLGMDKAIRIFYEANVNLLHSTATFLQAAQATVQAAVNLHYSLADQVSVAQAWQAVGVPIATPIDSSNDGVPVLVSGQTVSNIAGARNSLQYWKISVPPNKTLTVQISGGTGDADLYTAFGVKPTVYSYDCSSWGGGNNQSCTTSPTKSGVYYIQIRGSNVYSGVSLKASY